MAEAQARVTELERRIAVLESSPLPVQTSVPPTPASPAPTAAAPIPTAAPAPTTVPASAPAMPAPTAAPSPSSGRRDICYRSIPVQNALLGTLPGPGLCAAINVGELFRLERLQVNTEGRAIQRSDFADLVNLRHLEITGTAVAALAPDLFHDLISLESLRIEVDLEPNATLPPGALLGLPSSVESLVLMVDPHPDDVRRRAVRMPDDLFVSTPRLVTLVMRLDGSRYDHCLEVGSGTFSGLHRLVELRIEVGGYGVRPLPKDVFGDLWSLERLEFDKRPCRRDGDTFETDHEGLHQVYLPTLEALLQVADYCKSYYCEVVGLTEE